MSPVTLLRHAKKSSHSSQLYIFTITWAIAVKISFDSYWWSFSTISLLFIFFQMNSTDLSITGDISIASKFPVEISYKHFHIHSRNCHCIWLLFLPIIRLFRAGTDPENRHWSGWTVTDRIESVEKIAGLLEIEISSVESVGKPSLLT